MPRKSYKPEEIVAKLRQVDVLSSPGQSVAEAIRSIGVSEVTYYRWRQEFGGSGIAPTEVERCHRRALGPVHPARRPRAHPTGPELHRRWGKRPSPLALFHISFSTVIGSSRTRLPLA